MQKRIRKNIGFSLIEMIIVLMIVAIISVIVVHLFVGMTDTFTLSISRSKVHNSVKTILYHIIDDVRDGVIFTAISNNSFELTLQNGDSVKYITATTNDTYDVLRIINNVGSGEVVGSSVASLSGTPGLEFEYYDGENQPALSAANTALVLITLTMKYADNINTPVFATAATFHPRTIGTLDRRP